RLPVAIPGRGPVLPELALRHRLLERGERRPYPGVELGAIHLAELHLRIVDVVDVDRLETEIRATAVDLVPQVARRHAVGARHHVPRLEDAGPDVGLREVA